MKKKLLSIVLAVILLMSVAATTVSAVELYTFNTVDGKTVKLYDESHDITLTVFGRVTCGNTKSTLSQIIRLGIDDDHQVNFVSIDADTEDVVADFADEFSSNKISFCYDESGAGRIYMWPFAAYAGAISTVTLPVIAFVKSDGEIIDATSGTLTDSELRAIISDADEDESTDSETPVSQTMTLSVTGTENYDYAYSVLDSLNKLRKSQGLSTLIMREDLLEVAMQRAAETAIYFSHTRPDDTDCFTAYDGDYRTCGENIAIGQTTPAEVMSGWTNSPGHYANMVNENFNSVGIGVFKMSDGTICWVQFFTDLSSGKYTVSGTQKVTAKVDVLKKNLDVEMTLSSAKGIDSLAKGDTCKIELTNSNLQFPYAFQTLKVSDFNITSSDNSLLKVNSDGTATVKGDTPATVTLTATAKNNSSFSVSQKIEFGHKHSYTLYDQSTTRRTCVTETVKTYRCSVCGAKTKKTDTTGSHTFGSTVTTRATLTANGKTSKKCTVCGETVSTGTIYKPTKFILSQKEYVYNGKTRTPAVTVKDSKGKTLKKNTDYTLKYSSNRKKPGEYTVRITFKGKYSGIKRLTFTIVPKTTSKIVSSETSSSITLKWSKVTGATGYRIYQYNSKTKKFIKVKDTTSTSLKISKLSSGTTYKFRIKAYKESGSSTIWGSATDTYTTATKPAEVTISTLKSSATSQATVVWGKVTGATGYIVECSESESFDSFIETTVSKSTRKTTFNSLKSGGTYYVRVRAYKVVDGKNLYGSYSRVKNVKVK